MTKAEKKKSIILYEAYKKGVEAHKAGLPDINQYSKADLMQYCGWSAGYHDSKRGVV